MAKRPSWWVWPSVLTGSFAALTVLGTIAVNYATYAALPKRVEAQEVENKDQDKRLDKLITLQEYQQAANQPARPRMSPRFQDAATTEPIVETDQEGKTWCCDKATVDECWQPIDQSAKNSWEKCE